ncbi:4Fe-4S binding protein [Candidatus Dependentiae bacterium]|nr:4Fe-4S binding protein [Candidatus Dependentiae bacterium]
MTIRKIININESKCNGCGLCIPNCPEGALQIIDKKVRLVSDLFCDGLGACLGHCPEGAISIEERECGDYDEYKVMENVVKSGKNVIKAHLKHLLEHNELKYYEQALEYLKLKNIDIPEIETVQSCHSGGCPGSKSVDMRKNSDDRKNVNAVSPLVRCKLNNWPIQLKLINPSAGYFNNSDIVISSDCALAAYPDFNGKFLKDKILMILCPKLDEDIESYIEKLTIIFQKHNIKSITIINMEVPCCGVEQIVSQSLRNSGKNIILKQYTISIDGEII